MVRGWEKSIKFFLNLEKYQEAEGKALFAPLKSMGRK